jgi:hypothetical protein
MKQMITTLLLVLFTAICTFIGTYQLIITNQEIEATEKGYNVVIFGQIHEYE